MPLAPRPFDAGTIFAGYTIERRLGSGGMGEVYLAQHPRLPRQDALKVLRVTPLPPPQEPPPTPSASPPTAPPSTMPTTTAAAAPVAVIGADCSPLGSTGTTASRATAYCREDIRRSNGLP
jgi:serine/threonine protein kinase